MAKIYAPNTQYTGVSCGVRFVDGVGNAETDQQLDWLLSHGYSPRDPNAETAENEPEAKEDPEKKEKPVPKGSEGKK